MPPALCKLQRERRSHNPTPAERAQLAAWYARNPLVARTHLYEACLEPVDPALLPPQLPASLLGEQEWVRLRRDPRLRDRAGLSEWLEGLHSSELSHRCVPLGRAVQAPVIEPAAHVGPLTFRHTYASLPIPT